LVHSADLVLIMTVEPGAGGQSFMPEMMPKLLALHRYLGEQGLSPLVQVDGGITVETLPVALTHGADTFVAGSSVYGHGIPGDNIRALREAATKGEA
jgi:ribulose-phosphate 3-epimerase